MKKIFPLIMGHRNNDSLHNYTCMHVSLSFWWHKFTFSASVFFTHNKSAYNTENVALSYIKHLRSTLFNKNNTAMDTRNEKFFFLLNWIFIFYFFSYCYFLFGYTHTVRENCTLCFIYICPDNNNNNS